MAEQIKRWIWFLLFGLLWLPSILYYTGGLKLQPLQGAYTPAPDIELSKGAWLDGTFQETKNNYLNENFGLRPGLVRLSNQIDLSVFKIARGATLGKSCYLFYDEYIYATLGRDFMGYEAIGGIVSRMKYIQSELEKSGKTFLLVNVPMKTDYFHEYLPDWADKIEKGPTNGEVCRSYCDSLGVNQIDFNSVLLSLKNKIEGKLFTRQGIHWSQYGAMYAVDSIIKFLEHKRNIDLPNPEWRQVVHTDKARSADDDIGRTLNLIWPIKESYTYPIINFPPDTISDKPSAVYVGDSFVWPLIDDSLMVHTHSKWEFWYYFNTVNTAKSMRGEEEKVNIADYNWKEKLDSADCLILVFVPQNYNDMSRFVDSAYNYLKQKE